MTTTNFIRLSQGASRLRPHVPQFLLSALVLLAVAARPPLSRAQNNFPNFVGVGVPTVQVNISAPTQQGLTAAPTNGVPLRLTAQLVRNTQLDLPFNIQALTLAALTGGSIQGATTGGGGLVKAAGSPGFADACTLTNSSTMLECTLTPSPGPTWSAAGGFSLRVRLTATDGNSASTLSTFNIGLYDANVQLTLVAAPGQTPSTTNATPLRLAAQLVRDTIPVPPFDSNALMLAGSTLTPAAGSPAFAQVCALTNSSTMLECTLTPSPGPTWSTGPLIVRVTLTAVEGVVGTALSQFTIAIGGASLGVQFQCGNTCPNSANSAPVYLVAQMLRSFTPPAAGDAAILTIAPLTPGSIQGVSTGGASLAKANVSPAIVDVCSLTNSSTMLECTLNPVGPTWGVGAPLILRVRLTTTDGNVQVTLVQIRIT